MAHDPQAARQQREAAKARKRPEDAPLEPDFPFRREAFDPFYFGLHREPRIDTPEPA